MGAFAFVIIVMGLIALLGVLLIVRQRAARNAPDVSLDLPPQTAPVQTAMIVATLYGQLLHLNDTARQWLDLQDTAPDLEQLAERIQPSESFYALVSSGVGQASFRVGKRWVEAVAHLLPADGTTRVVIVLRELTMGGSSGQDVLDISTAMAVIHEIEETATPDLSVEQTLQVILEIVNRSLPMSAGEICLWDEERRFLQQRGWLGDMHYLLTTAERGGGYPLGIGVAGWAALHRETLVVGSDKDAVNLRQLLENNPYRSAVAAPLLLNNQLIGTLTLFHERRGRYTPAEAALLSAISRAVATAIQNAKLYASQEQRIHDIASLQNIANAPSTEREVVPIYQALTERLATLADCEICGVFLYDEAREALLPQLPFFGLPDHVASRFVLPLPPRTPQRTIWEKQSYWISTELREEPLITALNLLPLVELTGMRNAALFPLQIANKRIGMVGLNNKRGPFTPRDIQQVRVLVAQAALVVENIRLFQRERLIDTELVGLQEMTHAIGALSHEDEFYAEITQRIARLMRSEMCAILRYEGKQRRLVAQLPIYGVPDEIAREYVIHLPMGSVMDELWSEEDFWYSNRVQTDPLVYEAGLDALAERLGVQRTLFAVMTAGGRRIGALQVSNKQGHQDYDDKDARLLQIFATQAAAIIENARLYREVQVRAEQAESLRRVAEMASAVITTEQSFKPVLQEIGSFMASPIVYLNVADHSTNSLVTYPRWVSGIELLAPIIQDMGAPDFAFSVFSTGRPFFSNDITNDDRILPANYQIAQRLGLHSTALVPLSVGERRLGELGVANRTAPYTIADVNALQTLAAQIASAVERLLLYEATGENLRRRMEELDAIARISNLLTMTVDFAQIVNGVLQEVERATSPDDASVVIFRPRAQWRNANQPEVESRLGLESLGRSLADIEREALARGLEPIIVADYEASPYRPTEGARSAVAVAILYLDEVVGVIHAVHHAPNHFDDRAANFLLTLSTKASLGYQNAAYYKQQLERNNSLRKRADQLNRIFELGQMLHSNAKVDMLLEAVAYSVQQSVGFDTVLMLLVDEAAGVLRRVAHAGMPLDVFLARQNLTLPLDRLMDFLKPQYRQSESYFFPIEDFEQWYVDGLEALSLHFDDARSLDPRGRDEWHDGDLMFVTISGQGGNLLGLMALDRPYDNRRPDRSTVEVLEIFAHQASTMIENIRLFDESRRSAAQQAQLNTILEAASRTFDLNEIVQAVAKGISQILPVEVLTLAIADPDGQSFNVLRAVFDGSQAQVNQETRSTLERTALGRSYKDRSDYTYGEDDQAVRHYDDLRAWYGRGERSSLIVPLLAGGDVLGAMHFGSQQAHSLLAPEARTLLIRLAQLIAGTIQNARLFNQAVNLQALNRSVVESIQQGIVVLDRSGRIITVNEFMKAKYGWDDSALNRDLFAYQPELREPLSAGLQTVLTEGQPSERLGLISQLGQEGLIVRNFYLYPLRSAEAVRGAVMLVEDVTERAKLEEAVEMRANQLAALTEVSMRITASLERAEVINVAISEMGWIIPYDTMSVWRRNGSFMTLEGHSAFPNGRNLPNLRLKIAADDRLAQLVETQRVVAASSPVPLPSLDIPGDENARSWMGVPLVNQGHVVGMLVLSKAEEGLYDSRPEQNVAFAFASQVAIALANADLFEQTFERTNELGTLLEAAQATSASRDVHEVFRTVADLMFTALDMEDCTIMIWHEVDGELEVQFSVNRADNPRTTLPVGTRQPLSLYPARQRALSNRDVVVLIDAPQQSAPMQLYELELEDMRSMGRGARILVPLVVGDQSIGLIKLEQSSNDEQSVTQQKARLAKALGAQVAVAIQSARLTAETNARFEELLIINALSQAISSTLNIDDMLPIVKEQLTSITNADEVYLALYDADTQIITFPLAVRGSGAKAQEFYIGPRKLGMDEVSYIIKKRHSLSLGADYFSIDDLRRSMGVTNGEGDAKSYMGVPLLIGDQVLGVLAIRNRQRSRAFNLNDERILTTVASQLAAAIQNAKLFERVSRFAEELNRQVAERTEELEQERDRLDTLYQITSELARTLDMEQLLERALGMVSKAVGAQDGVIMLADPATDRLYCRAALNPNNLINLNSGEVTHPAQSLATWLIDSGQDHVVIIDDLHRESYWNPSISQARSALAVILESNEDPMGVMVLLSNEVAAFTENHIKLLVPAANQVAASINSADLYQLIREQAERLGRLLRTEQEEAQKSNAILESIADGVMQANSEGKIVLFNSAAERILGLPRRQAIGRHIEQLTKLYGEDALGWTQLVNDWVSSIRHPEPGADVIAERIETGERIISAQLSPVFSGEQFLGTVAVLRDVTKDVLAERAKNDFITSVSHEFRTPLTPIKGYTDLLLMGAGGDLSVAQQGMMNTIKENVERLTSLVNDVLNIAKIDRGDYTLTMQQVNVGELVVGLVDLFQGRAANQKKGLTVNLNLPPDLPRVRADRDKLLQIFSNIIDNAFKYTRSGGSITITGQSADEGRAVLMSIADTGVGIPDHFKEAAWRRFERYDEHALELDVAGTGLGLALVKELVLLHHGEVWFESQLGVGTTFFVKLPLEQPQYLTDTHLALTNPKPEQMVGD
ncbi:MAG: GAF domain-containing protein [Anaerolineae bacterium]|nr:GAF domain-containing protein [Anaerolineae bacterium]MDW8173894.1 GAF domain-containing protein [Anaerolineae bacterium]